MDVQELEEKLNDLALTHQNAASAPHSETDDDEHINNVAYDDDDEGFSWFSPNRSPVNPDPRHSPTTEELQPYFEERRISDGYDVSEYPDFYPDGMIVPIRMPWDKDMEEYIMGFTKFALDEYNKREGTKYEVVRTLKANNYCTYMFVSYYITFHAMDPDNPDAGIQTFQAQVLLDDDDTLRF